jgi:outer membrane receptor protein involved in Fe transport
VYDNFDESLNASDFDRQEHVPGIFAEYTYSADKFGAVVGARNDYHNLYGNQFSPKANFKYNFSKRGVTRLSAGRGWRVPNWFIENASTFVSNRIVLPYNNVQPEAAWNAGISATQKFSVLDRDLTLHGEYFYTWFENQLVADRETPGLLSFYNLNGESYSHAVQVEIAYQPWKVFDVRVAGKYLDVKSTYGGELKSVPMVPNWRGMVSLGYKTLNKKWQADLTTQFVGISRIPSTEGNQPQNVRSTSSDPYYLMNGQITRRFKWIELYAGVENLFNYKQPNAIISADMPFSSEFDASLVWAPVNGRVIYGGVRLKFFRK